MKKTILFLSFLSLGMFVFFGFTNPNISNKINTEKSISGTTNHNYTLADLFQGKCGDGNSSEAKPASSGEMKCAPGKCGEGMAKEQKCNHESGKACCKDKKSSSKSCEGMGMMGSDKDKDGKVSLEEFMSGCKANFATCDKNKDGKVTKEECSGFEHFGGQGTEIDEAGFVASHEKMFKEMDKNNDGFLVGDEFKSCKPVCEKDAKSCSKEKAKSCEKDKAKCTKDKAKCTGDKSKSEGEMKCAPGKCGGSN